MKISAIFLPVIAIACAAIGALVWPYTINAWLVYAGKPPAVLWWHGALLGLVPGLGQFAAPLAILTWVLMLFLV